VISGSRVIAGPGKLLDPTKLVRAYISPRQRAQRTFELLFGQDAASRMKADGKIELTEDIAEWQYGAYEGLLTKEIRAKRKENGLDQDKEWDIWRDGCEDGESAEQVSDRLDALIERIREIQAPHMKDDEKCDILLVAHGHSLRAFAKRWLGYPLDNPLSLMLEPGGVGVLSYQHHNIKEPALLLGIGFAG